MAQQLLSEEDKQLISVIAYKLPAAARVWFLQLHLSPAPWCSLAVMPRKSETQSGSSTDKGGACSSSSEIRNSMNSLLELIFQNTPKCKLQPAQSFLDSSLTILGKCGPTLILLKIAQGREERERDGQLSIFNRSTLLGSQCYYFLSNRLVDVKSSCSPLAGKTASREPLTVAFLNRIMCVLF